MFTRASALVLCALISLLSTVSAQALASPPSPPRPSTYPPVPSFRLTPPSTYPPSARPPSPRPIVPVLPTTPKPLVPWTAPSFVPKIPTPLPSIPFIPTTTPRSTPTAAYAVPIVVVSAAMGCLFFARRSIRSVAGDAERADSKAFDAQFGVSSSQRATGANAV